MAKFKRIARFIDGNVNRAGYWWPIITWLFALFGGGTALMTWLGAHWEALAAHGWAAVVLFGISASTVVIFVLSIAAFAWRYFRSVANAPSDGGLGEAGNTKIVEETPHNTGLLNGYENDHHRQLMHFVLDDLVPAIKCRVFLHGTIIKNLTANRFVLELAERGIWGCLYSNEFEKATSRLVSLAGSSPFEIASCIELQECVQNVEKGYRSFCLQLEKLDDSDIAISQHNSEVYDAYVEWVDSHNRLTRSYDEIKRDDSFKKLYRPAKQNRFGRPIDPPAKGEPFLTQLLPGTTVETPR